MDGRVDVLVDSCWLRGSSTALSAHGPRSDGIRCSSVANEYLIVLVPSVALVFIVLVARAAMKSGTSRGRGSRVDRDGLANGRQSLRDETRAAPEENPSPGETDDYRARLERLCDLLVAEFVSSLDSSGRDTRDSRAGGMCFGIATEGDPDGCLMFLAQRHAVALGADQGTAEAAESLVRSFGFDPASGHDFRSALDQFGSIRDGVLELMITGDEMETFQAIQAVRSRGEDNTVMVLRAAGLLLANLEAPR